MKFEDVQSLVAKPSAYLAAEIELGDIQVRQQVLTDAIASASGRLGGEDTLRAHAAMQEISKVERERGRMTHRSTELRRQIQELKPGYAKAVRIAIGHHRREAAMRVAQALRDFEAAAADLKAAEKILIGVEANPQKFADIPFLSQITASIQRVVAECDRDLRQ